jgi:chromate transport protein ChrA
MIRGSTTRPNLVSWLLWTILLLIGIFAQFSAGASWSVILLIASAFNTALVTVLILFGYGYKKYGRLDIACFVLALVAIVLWHVTGDPVLAIVLAICADFLAGSSNYPSKSYKEPFSESLFSWTIISLWRRC